MQENFAFGIVLSFLFSGSDLCLMYTWTRRRLRPTGGIWVRRGAFFARVEKKAGKKYAFTLYVKYKFFFRKTIKQTAEVWVYVIAHISANPRYMCAGS